MTTISDDLIAAWNRGDSLDEPLSRLVIATGSRAAGCWRLDSGHLKLIGFGWAGDMTLEVSEGFRQATRCVSLEQHGLGIVKAVTTNTPTIALRDPELTGLEKSASWIVRFDANSSLAIPIPAGKTDAIGGAIAVSTAAVIEEGDALWQMLVDLAQRLGLSTQA